MGAICFLEKRMLGRYNRAAIAALFFDGLAVTINFDSINSSISGIN